MARVPDLTVEVRIEPQPCTMETVRFKRGADGQSLRLDPYPRVFLVSRALEQIDAIELRPLTVARVLAAVAENNFVRARHRVRLELWRAGFVDAFEGKSWDAAEWRWKFWAPRKGTEPKVGGAP